MSEPGWYPDPGGQDGMFRYWNGSAWSPTVSPTPGGAPPGPGGFDPTQPLTGSRARQTTHTPGPPRPEGGRVWWIIGLAAAVALVIVIALAVRGGLTGLASGSKDDPNGGMRDSCPLPVSDPKPTQPPTRDGRVFGGRLSYPELPAPWSPPSSEARVPYGHGAVNQTIRVETNANDPMNMWVASVTVSELMAGDGFYSPQQGSEIIVKCILGSFYGNNDVHRDDQVNRAMKVGGHEAWLVESHLTFDAKGFKTKGELMIVLIVSTAEGEASLYYASIPDTARQWEAPARQAMADLQVS